MSACLSSASTRSPTTRRPLSGSSSGCWFAQSSWWAVLWGYYLLYCLFALPTKMDLEQMKREGVEVNGYVYVPLICTCEETNWKAAVSASRYALAGHGLVRCCTSAFLVFLLRCQHA
jgi:hypothetical protein